MANIIRAPENETSRYGTVTVPFFVSDDYNQNNWDQDVEDQEGDEFV